MQEYQRYLEEEFIIYNSQLTLRDFVWIEKIEKIKNSIYAFLEVPYEMVKFDLDELINVGKVSFEACEVYTTKRWQEDQIKIQRDAFLNQRKNQQRFEETIKNFTSKKQRNDKKHRELLSLPIEGNLDIEQIKIAYRKIVKKVHPDVGGSHEKFIEITVARDYLLETL